jgi:arylsulfatase A-like enzyme
MKQLTGFLSLFVLAALPCLAWPAPAERPNILWITAEDHGPHLGCYGDTYATTPNLDRLAARGMIYTRAWSCLPVCAPARTAIIVGMYPNSTGGQHMRSMVAMPRGVRMYPQYLREAGYYCTNNSKTDYNLPMPGKVWDESSGKAHWKNRKAGQPFFAIFNFTGSHESRIWNKEGGLMHDPAKVRVPAYHPDTPAVRADWAKYYDNVTRSDTRAGELLAELQSAGLSEDTIVFYYADHGAGMPRSKRTACDSGLRVPLIVYFPKKWQHLAPKDYKPGGKSSRLVNFVDLAPTLLSLAGIKPPAIMQGLAIAGPYQTPPPKFMHGLRGRMDGRYDLVRTVTDGRYIYIRNYMPHIPHGQHVTYQFRNDTTRTWYRLFQEGKLNAAQAYYWTAPRAPEELYDLQNDPDEVRNLASSPEHQATLAKLRKAEQDHAARIRDVGFLPEAEMNRRAGKRSPYDMARAGDEYPFARVFETAELASSLKAEALPELRQRLADRDSAVRYWAVMGLRMRGADVVKAHKKELLKALNDKNPNVRIAAAEALGIHGDDEAARAGVMTLLSVLEDHARDVHVVLTALNTLDYLGKRVALVDRAAAVVKAVPNRDSQWERRSAAGIKNLKDDILANLSR